MNERVSHNDVINRWQREGDWPEGATGIAWGGDPADSATTKECIDCLLDSSWRADPDDEPTGVVLYEPVESCWIHDILARDQPGHAGGDDE